MTMPNTQANDILKHLAEHGSITSYEAFSLYGCTRLSGQIFNLKKQGYKITSTNVNGYDRRGRKIHFTVYKMEAE